MLIQVYEALWGLILPEYCPRCGLGSRVGFCEPCRRDFVANRGACPVCGDGPMPLGMSQCAAHPQSWHIQHAVAPLKFTAPLNQYIHELKFGGQRSHARALGQILAEVSAKRRAHVDSIVSVPLHTERLLHRGYNQALEIARTVSAILRLPILRKGIIRNRKTLPQTQFSAAERFENLSGAFTVSRPLRRQRIAIVDDVLTTGATVNSLASALRSAGATHVEAWVVARTATPQSNEKTTVCCSNADAIAQIAGANM